ncbi:MAG: helix-turn-helix transcriptional regulator [Verrucomicrobiota bacterium]
MPAFSRCLTSILKRQEWKSGKALAHACGMNPSRISQWKNGKGWPERHALAKLAEVLPGDAAELIAAWVKDLLPRESTLVSIEPRRESSSVREDEAPYHAWHGNVPKDLRQMFSDFAELAMVNEDVMKIVEVLHAAAMRMRTGK